MKCSVISQTFVNLHNLSYLLTTAILNFKHFISVQSFFVLIRYVVVLLSPNGCTPTTATTTMMMIMTIRNISRHNRAYTLCSQHIRFIAEIIRIELRICDFSSQMLQLPFSSSKCDTHPYISIPCRHCDSHALNNTTYQWWRPQPAKQLSHSSNKQPQSVLCIGYKFMIS